jgi:hypothetical protein
MHWVAAVVHWLGGAVVRHKESLVLFGLGLISAMRNELPSPLNRVEIFVWWYGWIHDALKTLVNLKSPGAALNQAPGDQTKKQS